MAVGREEGHREREREREKDPPYWKVETRQLRTSHLSEDKLSSFRGTADRKTERERERERVEGEPYSET